jgi:hypothetical protein
MDSRIKSSIRTAVEEEGQPVQVAEKLIKWFENVANGNETLEEKSDYKRRVEGLYDAVEVTVEE